MSNPSINRWGLNLFWYRYWYADRTSQLYIQQDYIFNKLIYIYLFYGILFPHNIFIKKYWYNFSGEENWQQSNYNEKYYRKAELKGTFLNELTVHRLRNKIKHLYFSKIWIFRFQNWLILNFYSFQPLKKNINKLSNSFKSVNDYNYKNKACVVNFKRIKLLLYSYLVNSRNVTQKNYQF